MGCDPLNDAAVQQLLALKDRPESKGLILIAASFDQLRPFVGQIETEIMKTVMASWPGPNTWILPAAENLPRWLSGAHKSLAVRVTGHPVAAALCRACNSPLVSSSANPSGCRPARTAFAVRRFFPTGVDLIVTAPVGDQAQPTRIRNAIDGREIRP